MPNFSLALFLILGFAGCSSLLSEKTYQYQGDKLDGVSFVATRAPIGDSAYLPIKAVHADWISLMPYGYTEGTTPEFVYGRNKEWHYWGESPEGVAHCVRMAHAQGLKVMLKPHMWVGRGIFTGHFDLKNEADWQTFEKGFGTYLLDFAKIAEETDVELYCIATEMQTFVKERPAFWFDIIKQIRGIYHGKLTYAENWDVYEAVPFWDQMDYVGIDGYFPLAEAPSPTLAQLKTGWKPHLKAMERFAAKVKKPILFTEYGYMSSDFAARRPWETDRDRPENDALQARTYEAFFEEVWTKPWMAGGFVWKWFPTLKRPDRARDPFSPQHKEAERVLARYYEQSTR